MALKALWLLLFLKENNMQRTLYTSSDFDWVLWSEADIEQMVDKVLAGKRSAFERIKQVAPQERTFRNTIFAVEASDYEINSTISRIEVLMFAHPKLEIREASKRALDKFQREIVDIMYDEGVYRAAKEYVGKGISLAGADKKLCDDMMRDFKRMGFELEPEWREKFKRNLKELNRLCLEFSKNINDYEDSLAVTKEELAGLPESYIQGLGRDAEGRYLVTLKYPDYQPFMKNAVNAGRRKELALKFLKRGGELNMELLEQILKLRMENAKLLGYPTHADYVAEERMAKTATHAYEFLHALVPRLQPGVKRNMSELEALKREITGKPEARIETILNKVTEQAENLVLETFDEANEGIKKGAFGPNLLACNNGYKCQFYDYCWKGDDKDLVVLEEKV